MNHPNLLGVLIAFIFFAGCVPMSPPSAAETSSPNAYAKSKKEWPGIPFTRVVAYRYAQLGELPGIRDPVDTLPLTIGHDGNPDLEMLLRRKTGDRELTPSQVEKVIDGCWRNASRPSAVSRCIFEPRHIFIFYSADNKPVAYAEVCLKCHQGNAYPEAAAADDWNIGVISGVLDEIGLL